LGLLVALDLRRSNGRLESPEERVVSTLRVEVVADEEQPVPVVGKLACEGLAT
jgi:hypothetical protein